MRKKTNKMGENSLRSRQPPIIRVVRVGSKVGQAKAAMMEERYRNQGRGGKNITNGDKFLPDRERICLLSERPFGVRVGEGKPDKPSKLDGLHIRKNHAPGCSVGKCITDVRNGRRDRREEGCQGNIKEENTTIVELRAGAQDGGAGRKGRI